MDENRSPRNSTSPVPDPFFYRRMVIPRHAHTPAEFTLEIKVDVGVKGTRNASTVARDRYGVRWTRSIASRDANKGRTFLS